MTTKRLFIKVATTYDGDYKYVPVNGGNVEVKSEFGQFVVSTQLKQFDGSKPHLSNSFYNLGDTKKLDGSEGKADAAEPSSPNLRLQINFTPAEDIPGNSLIFGNDFTTPIKDYVPTSILNTGLKFYTWFISKTVKGDVYADKPYLYQSALNCFTLITLQGKGGEVLNYTKDYINYSEQIDLEGEDGDDGKKNHHIPRTSVERKKFYDKPENTHHFTFRKNRSYVLRFDTNYLKMSDSKYAISIPTFGNKTFDISVLRFANEKLNNVNFVLKKDGMDGVDHGQPLLVINFGLLDEDDDKTESK